MGKDWTLQCYSNSKSTQLDKVYGAGYNTNPHRIFTKNKKAQENDYLIISTILSLNDNSKQIWQLNYIFIN